MSQLIHCFNRSQRVADDAYSSMKNARRPTHVARISANWHGSGSKHSSGIMHSTMHATNLANSAGDPGINPITSRRRSRGRRVWCICSQRAGFFFFLHDTNIKPGFVRYCTQDSIEYRHSRCPPASRPHVRKRDHERASPRGLGASRPIGHRFELVECMYVIYVFISFIQLTNRAKTKNKTYAFAGTPHSRDTWTN